MHFSSATILFTLLPSLIAAEQQAPLKEKVAILFDKAKQYIPSGSVPNPIDAAAAKIAEQNVEKINIRNYERKLGPKLDGEEEWMIYLTGGNKSCHGRCGRADATWNESVAFLRALPQKANAKLRLGSMNCEVEEVLCTGMGLATPSILHFIFPQAQAGTDQPLSPMHEIRLNYSTVATSDILTIPRAAGSGYLKVPEYTGAFHPVDGVLAKYKLLVPLGYVLWGFGSTPSWLIMIGVSFFSRQFMAKRATSRPGLDTMGGGRPAAAPAAAPASPAAAAGGGRSGGGKKRK